MTTLPNLSNLTDDQIEAVVASEIAFGTAMKWKRIGNAVHVIRWPADQSCPFSRGWWLVVMPGQMKENQL